MLVSSFGLMYFLKASKSKKTERFIYLRITVEGKSTEISTKRVWFPERWQQRTGKAIGTKEDARELNAYLETITQKVYQAKKILMEEDKSITPAAIRDLIFGGKKDKLMVRKVFDEYISKMEALLDIEYSSGTIKKYRTTKAHVLNFINHKYFQSKINHKEVDFELNNIDFEFINELEFWIKTVKKCGHNTTIKYLGRFKKVISLELKKGNLKRNPFSLINLTVTPVQVEPLNQTELDKIINKEFRIPRLDLVKDIFIFSCYTGLAYIDVLSLRKQNIEVGIDGQQWFFTDRAKTGTPTRVPLLPVALDILEKYKDDPRVKYQGFALPVLSNQKMNSYLKEIADLCGIIKNLTFHIARHTFATTITLNNGVPLETVSKLLGHKSIKQTQHYAKLLDFKVSQDMLRLKGVLDLKKNTSLDEIGVV